MNTLTLNIANLEALKHGVLSRHQFDCKGGTIGSQGADWLIADCDQRIQPLHCEIRWLEGSFCAIDCCNQTYLNHSQLSLGQHTPVRLQDGDQLRIGAYRLQVHYQPDQMSSPSLEALFMSGQKVLDALVANTWHSEMEVPDSPAVTDICEAFASGIGHDPLAALSAKRHTEPRQENDLQRLLMGKLS